MLILPERFRKQFEHVHTSEMAAEMRRGEKKLSQYCKYIFENIPTDLRDQMKEVHDTFEFENLTGLL